MGTKGELQGLFPVVASSDDGSIFHIEVIEHREDMCFLLDEDQRNGVLLISIERCDENHVLSYEQRVAMGAAAHGITYEIRHTDASEIKSRSGVGSDAEDQEKVKRQLEVVAYLREGALMGASEMRIVTTEKRGYIRYKVDNESLQKPDISREHAEALQYSLYNSMTEEAGIQLRPREPQDANLRATFARDASLSGARISTWPLDGKNLCVTCRLIPIRKDGRVRLAETGIPNHVLNGLGRIIRKRYGVFLVTGPTGSGKSSFAVRFLEERAILSDDKSDIFTVEHPVEYKMIGDGFFQGPLDVDYQDPDDLPKAYGRAQSALLRQAPNVVFPGESRDAAAGQFLYRMADTGHFCMSTLHVGAVEAAIRRLELEMGISKLALLDPNLTLGVMNMDLVRTVCTHCAAPMSDHEDKFDPEAYDVFKRYIDVDRARIGLGCRECKQRGNKGRMPVMELLETTRSYFDEYESKGPLASRIYWVNHMGGRTKVMHLRRLINQGLVDPRIAAYDVAPVDHDFTTAGIPADVHQEFVYG